ncbi:MAG TPA: tryptophan synthase subunit beta [bacterium]|nr:tryptophan synthase subunit beta [bacterium]
MRRLLPNKKGYFGAYGGRYAPETLMQALDELTCAYGAAKRDPAFQKQIRDLLTNYVGRPTPLFEARRLSARAGCRLFLKREDLTHTGSHKINNTIGQVLLARRLGKTRVVAETGAGQHGVAAATACALMDMKCAVYMGTEDMRRQKMNVFRMDLLGAQVIPVESGSRTLKDAINEAFRDWVANTDDTFYCFGSVVGPHPYPRIVRDFQGVIGRETRKQIRNLTGRLPDLVAACVGGGSNAMGIFHAFLEDQTELVGVEAGGRGGEPEEHGAPLNFGSVGVLHGARSYLMQDAGGQVLRTHSVSAGLDYPGVGPEHAFLKDSGRVRYVTANDREALNAFRMLSCHEGILPALESSHALAWVLSNARDWRGKIVIVNLSGRGDKDLELVESLT